MAVLVNGMEMPKEPDEWIEIVIFGNGMVIQTGESWRNLENGKYYYTPTTPEKFFNAVPVPPHGDLIDRKALLADTTDMLHSMMVFGGARVYTSDAIKNAPTIIPAEPSEEQREYEAAVEAAQYCEMHEPSYDLETGAM